MSFTWTERDASAVDLARIGPVVTHGNTIEGDPVKGPLSIGQVLVGHNYGRDLVFLGKIKGLCCQSDRLFGITGRENDAGEFTMPRMKGEEKVRLLRPRRKTCRRSRPLCKGNDNGRFRHGCERKPFGHEGEPAPGSPGHRPDARV